MFSWGWFRPLAWSGYAGLDAYLRVKGVQDDTNTEMV